MLIVECFCEVIEIIDQKSSAIYVHCLTNLKVFRSEVLLDLICTMLHYSSWERGWDIITVLGNLVATNEDRERIMAIIGEMNFPHLQSVIHQVILWKKMRGCLRLYKIYTNNLTLCNSLIKKTSSSSAFSYCCYLPQDSLFGNLMLSNASKVDERKVTSRRIKIFEQVPSSFHFKGCK